MNFPSKNGIFPRLSSVGKRLSCFFSSWPGQLVFWPQQVIEGQKEVRQELWVDFGLSRGIFPGIEASTRWLWIKQSSNQPTNPLEEVLTLALIVWEVAKLNPNVKMQQVIIFLFLKITFGYGTSILWILQVYTCVYCNTNSQSQRFRLLEFRLHNCR